MDYRVSLRVKTQENEWLTVGKNLNIPWNLRDLIAASSGWAIINQDTVGMAGAFATDLRKGIMELEQNQNAYVGYEVAHGLGSIREVLYFYQELLKECREYPFTEVYGYVV